MTRDEIDLAFAPIAEPVLHFAEAHTFQLDKCVRGNSGWELVKPHDLGGSIYLLLLFKADLGLGIGSTWHFPCPEMSLAYSHFRPVRPCPLDGTAVVSALNSELHELTKIKFGYWTHIEPLRSPATDESKQKNIG